VRSPARCLVTSHKQHEDFHPSSVSWPWVLRQPWRSLPSAARFRCVQAVAAASARSPSAYEARSSHDALIAARREGRVTPAQALQQLKAWLALTAAHQAPQGAPGEDARRRIASDAIAIAAADGQYAEAVALARQFPPVRPGRLRAGPAGRWPRGAPTTWRCRARP
jgi:hypothetical protein